MSLYDREWRQRVRRFAADEDSDGCSGVGDLYADCCFEHDHAYRTGRDVYLAPTTRAAADAALRRCIQAHSLLGRFDPLSWWRWAGVRLFGAKSWKGSLE